jgi:hypothetical protein
MSPLFRSCALAAGLGLAAAPASGLAHHSFAMFDTAKVVALTGAVKDFQWSNPHVVITLLAAEGAGPPELWFVELTSPGNLTRQGWTRQALKPGDKVVVLVNPQRDGARSGSFLQVTFTATGKVIKGGQLVVKPL